MKRIFFLAMMALAAAGSLIQSQAPLPFPTGAKPTPFPRIVEAIRSGKATIHKRLAAPSQVIVVPKKLSYWGNNQYGDCVTAESVFSMAAYSTYLGIEQIFVTDADTIAWARSHGWLNGAFLLDVIQDMQKDGIKDDKGKLRKAGVPSSVDYSNEETLKSAIAQGPVSIAIGASSLPSGAGNKSGWYSFGGRQNQNSDHCIALCGYGPTSELFKALNTVPPPNAPANAYLAYTWSTMGVVDHPWIMSTVVEGWVRNPTVTDLGPPPLPPPPVGTITVSVPNVTGAVNTAVRLIPTATGGVSPYIFIFDYGDGTMDPSGSHAYKTEGSFRVSVTGVDSKGQMGVGTCVAAIGTNPPPPPPPPPPGPGGAGVISWTINGQTSTWELFPVGTRQKLGEILGPIAP